MCEQYSLKPKELDAAEHLEPFSGKPVAKMTGAERDTPKLVIKPNTCCSAKIRLSQQSGGLAQCIASGKMLQGQAGRQSESAMT